MVNINDIAKEAGVSKATVSKALNGYAGVKEETRKKVHKIAKKYGYFPNATAKALITKKNWLVGIVFTESLNIGIEHPHFAGVIESFKKTMEQNGYDTMFITNKIENTTTDYIIKCRHRNVDGLFICTFAQNDDLLKQLFESEIKCVATDIRYSDKVPIVISDNEGGIMLAYDYLYKNNHRNIAFIAANQDTLSARERLTGFRLALKKYNKEFKTKYVSFADNYNFESGYKAFNELFKSAENNLPTAIIASSDTIARGAIRAIKDKGLRVPHDFSVIGFDNDEYSKLITPALTTIAQNRRLLGLELANALIKLMNNEEVEAAKTIPVELVERNTVLYLEKNE